MKPYILTSILLICLFFNFRAVRAQTVTGMVYGNDKQGKREALPGVIVHWAGSVNGASTNAEGKFTIQATKVIDKRLVFNLLGYTPDTLVVGDKTHIEVTLHEKANELSAVEVKGKVGGSYISQFDPRKVQVITSTELRKAACCNLAESFETNASVDVMYADALTGAKQIQMLGLSGVYSQVISENVPLVRGLASSFGLGYIPGAWMESILVSKGASSVVNGFESTTGQIMVEYKKPDKSEPLFVNLFINSFLRAEANVQSAQKINKKLGAMLFGHVSRFGSPFDKNGDGFMDVPKNTTVNLMNRWDYTLPEKFTSHVGIKYFDENRTGGFMGFTPNSYTYDNTGISEGTKSYGIQMHTRRAEAFIKNGFMFKENPDKSVALIVSGIYHLQNDKLGLNKYEASQKSIYANLLYANHIVNSNHKFITGLSLMADNYKENYFRRDFMYLYQTAGMDKDNIADTLYALTGFKDNNYNKDRVEIVPGAFFEYTMHLRDKFTFIAGIRADHHNIYGVFITPRMHIRYVPTKGMVLRASVGKGYRTANVLSENYAIMAGQRQLHVAPNLNQENAWNMGVNATQNFKLFGNDAQLDVEAYRTDFLKQVIVDLDKSPTDVYIYNLNGKSFSNVFQAQLSFKPMKSFSILTAFRYNDVKVTENGELRRKAMSSRYKGLLTASYATKFDKWKFDATLQLNGKARIPDMRDMPEQMQRNSFSPAFVQLLSQITRKFKYFEVYLGGENLTNFTQKDPITNPTHPYHPFFDTSMVWGPIVGSTIYAGFRYSLQ